MRRILLLLSVCLSLNAAAGEFEESLLVQTGVMTESDLVVRNISDLGKNKTCLAFYIKTAGTSPVVYCYEAAAGFGAKLSQIGHIKADDLVVRKLEDTKNQMVCVVAYVGTPGTAPGVDCFASTDKEKQAMREAGHIREGDLDVRRIVDPGNRKTCLVTYVSTKGTAPTVSCYDSGEEKKGGLYQSSHLREGDLVVRKIVDSAAGRACLVSYVATAGTSSHVYCYPE